jgi:thiamine biosynthesis lipoprotein
MAANLDRSAGGKPDLARRRWSRGLAACSTFTFWPLAASARAEPARLRSTRPLMGTRVEIAAQHPDEGLLAFAIEAAFKRMAALEAQMSHYSPTSQVAALGAAAGVRPVPVSAELMRVLQMAQGVSALSEGAFDATIGSVGRWDFNSGAERMPSAAHIRDHVGSVDWKSLELDPGQGTACLRRPGMKLDLGGIAKLPILEAGLNTLQYFGVENALVNGGGDVLAVTDAATRPWCVGIRDPRQPDRLLGTVELRRGFVASSGDYERFFVRDGRRYHHVLDPRTGYPAEGPHGVTLVGETLEQVNGLGAAAMVLLAGAGRELLQRHGVGQALIAGRDGELWISPALQRRLRPA